MSRRRSDLTRWLVAVLALGTAWAGQAGAQVQLSLPIEEPPHLQVVVVDQERLFDDSLYGQRVLAEIDARSTELAAENRRIEAELTAEERALTERRKTVTRDAFRTLAVEFDERVTALRAEQDAKLRAVARLRDEARQEFYGLIGDILRDILAERGALVLLDRRTVLSAVEGADITASAIARIDAEIGDGAAPGDAEIGDDSASGDAEIGDGGAPGDAE